jgi:hypothetical protein
VGHARHSTYNDWTYGRWADIPQRNLPRLPILEDETTEHASEGTPSLPRSAFDRCPCGHPWIRHDIEEYDGDGSDTCCVEGCSQVGCPGRTLDASLGLG